MENGFITLREMPNGLFEKAMARRRLGFGVPPLGGSRAMPPEGGIPNHDFQTGSKRGEHPIAASLKMWKLSPGKVGAATDHRKYKPRLNRKE
jgi:hypothetical protein